MPLQSKKCFFFMSAMTDLYLFPLAASALSSVCIEILKTNDLAQHWKKKKSTIRVLALDSAF